MKKTIYNPKDFEHKLEKFWKSNNFFNLEKKGRPFFSIVLPPPNVTGNLHLGHAWDSYYPDLLIRYKSLLGFNVKWFPGTDHAGIATQAKIEKIIWEEDKKTKFDLGREEFVNQIWKWKKIYQENIFNQWDKIGLALSYQDLKFTLDDDVNKIVNDAFLTYYENGLIYRDKKIVNWDPSLKTVISNIEIVKKETISKFYHIKYQLKDSEDYLVVATTRPETIFGDVALFVNPKDQRYFDYHNKIVVNPLTKREMKILVDKYVDQDFGSGVLKVTPAHDFNDYELAKKHNLEFINIFDEKLLLNEEANNFKGLNREQAREEIIKDFKENNILEKITEINNFLPFSQRSNALVEPILSMQWFLKTSALVSEIIKIQNDEKEKMNFYPSRFEKDFLKWIKETEDWCISRQLWWGHRLPVWYDETGNFKVSIKPPAPSWKQSEDVLDTWFSSSFWPLVYLDQSKIKDSLNYPALSDTLFTGYDIIFFWVARMVIQSLYFKNVIPFKNVILHGLIRDKNNQKMSKSLNNGIDPIAVIDKWGSDTLRMFLLGNSTPGNDIRFNEEKLRHYWDINNKIFNINKLIKSWDLKINKDFNLEIGKITFIDQYILERANNLLEIIIQNVEKYNLAIIYQEIINFVLNDFAGIYLEIVKKMDQKQKINSLKIFIKILIMLHPFIPFLTEEIYQEWTEKLSLKKSILLEEYPKFKNINLDHQHLLLIDLIKTQRLILLDKNYQKQEKILMILENVNDIDFEILNKYLTIFNVEIKQNKNLVKFNGVNVTLKSGAIYYYFSEKNLKTKKELNQKALEKFNFELNRAQNLIKNKKFVDNAKFELVEDEKAKIEFYSGLIKLLNHETKI